MSPRPILPRDFAILARRIDGVERAAAIDGWDGDLETGNHDRTISVACIDEEGAAVGSTVKAAVLAYLESLREVNFLIYVIDPTSNSIDVSFTATALEDYDPSEVEERAIDTITEYLQPYNWGLPPAGIGESREWRNSDTVRYLDVAAVLKNVDGIDVISALTVEGGTSDVSLTGAAPLTTPGTIAGTVT